MATLMSVQSGMPMVVRRKEAKDYGTKKMVEGVWREGQACLVVEDVVTTGSSVLETAALLRDHGMVVKDCVVLLDREQGAVKALSGKGVTVHAVLKVSSVLDVLLKHEKISEEMAENVRAFLSGSKMPEPQPITLAERIDLAFNTTAKKLLQAMVEQSSNLCVSIDCTTSEEVLRLADLIGPEVVLVKLHRYQVLLHLVKSLIISHTNIVDYSAGTWSPTGRRTQRPTCSHWPQSIGFFCSRIASSPTSGTPCDSRPGQWQAIGPSLWPCTGCGLS